jgi:hypothetical protein
MAQEAWRLVKAGTAALSFGYLATDAFMRADGIQELRELDLYEISLTPTPANPDTRILSFKSTDPPESEPEPQRDTLSPEWQGMRNQARDEMYALLTAPLESDPEVVLEREEKRQARELRRQCDRLLLEAALGFDEDLIKRLDA